MPTAATAQQDTVSVASSTAPPAGSGIGTWRPIIALLLLFGVLYLLSLGVRPLAIPDETRYAEIPREMLATGDWVVPHLNGLRYFEKPVLGYWLTAASIAVFGENAFAVRLPAALSAGVTALLLFLLVRRWSTDPLAAPLAAAIYLTLPEVWGIGVMAVLDGPLALFLSAGLAAWFAAYAASGGRREFLWLTLSGIAFGLAFLVKGFLAFAVPVAVIVPFAIVERRWSLLFARGWLPLLAAALTIAPWAILIQWREPDFWHYFFWVEHIQRFLSEDAPHRAPVWFFVPALLVLALPWSTQSIGVVAGLRGAACERSLLRYAGLWLLMPLLFFSASRGKLVTYILPCFAPLAMLLAIAIRTNLQRRRTALFNAGAWVGAGLFVVAALALLFVQTAAIGVTLYSPDETTKGLALVSALFVAAGLLGAAARRPAAGTRLLLSVAAPVVVFAVLPFVVPQRSLDVKSPGEFLRGQRDQIAPQTILVSDNELVHALAWYFRRDDLYLMRKGELRYGLSYPDSGYRFLGNRGLRQLIDNPQRCRPVAVFYRRHNAKHLDGILTRNLRTRIQGTFVMKFFPAPGCRSHRGSADVKIS